MGPECVRSDAATLTLMSESNVYVVTHSGSTYYFAVNDLRRENAAKRGGVSASRRPTLADALNETSKSLTQPYTFQFFFFFYLVQYPTTPQHAHALISAWLSQPSAATSEARTNKW